MDKDWVIRMIKRNKHNYWKSIHLIADFLVISIAEAKEIYAKEINNETR